MSATGRGAVRHADDFYATPGWVTRAILPHLKPDITPGTIVEPCCGSGAIAKELLDYGVGGARLALNELDPVRGNQTSASLELGVAQFDFLDNATRQQWLRDKHVSLIITNPPYSLAQEFIEASLRSGAETVCMLLRLNFLGSKKRARWHQENPSDIYVLPRRPSFTNGGTDACEYGWFVWAKWRGNNWYMLDVEGKAA